MAFSTRRGRPPRAKLDDHDHGTPELQFKRALGITREPIDLCLEHGVITPQHHWCGLHLRWLYTLRYGAPVTTTRYVDRQDGPANSEENPEWRALREREYHAAVALLQRLKRYEPVMRLCIFNEAPAFLDPAMRARSWHEPALAERLLRGKTMLIEGLELLEAQWKRGVSTHAAPSLKRTDLTKISR